MIISQIYSFYYCKIFFMNKIRKETNVMNSIKKIIKSDLATGVLLMCATMAAVFMANSHLQETYHYLLSGVNLIGKFNLHMLINDFLMAIFFLVVGLEIKNEILYGNLSSLKKASFPVIAALGGVIVPAIIFMLININTEFIHGVGVPISTDIAFAIAIFMIFRKKLNSTLKIFLLSLAVVDDLISIFAIGVLYSSHIDYSFIILAVGIVVLLFMLNKVFKVRKVYPYMILGLIVWYFVYKSGVHATISGVVLAFTIPTKSKEKESESIANKIEHVLSPISNLIILPLFAFANTGINFNVNINHNKVGTLINGIILGLVIGKPLGIMLFTSIASKLNITEKPKGVSWASLFKVSMLAGIGFTMSIFVSELAFSYNHNLINIAKISILMASIITLFSSYLVIIVLPQLKNKCGICIKFKKLLYH